MDDIAIDLLERRLRHNPDSKIDGPEAVQLLVLLNQMTRERDEAHARLQTLEKSLTPSGASVTFQLVERNASTRLARLWYQRCDQSTLKAQHRN